MHDHAIARGLPWRRLSVLLMYAPMTLQRKTISKRRRTYFTLVRLLTGVHLGVVLQMCRLRECRAAYFTFVWLLPSVYATMIPQRGMARKSLVAYPAHIRTLSAVRAFMVLEMWRLRELHATRLAPGKERGKTVNEYTQLSAGGIRTYRASRPCESAHDSSDKQPWQRPIRRWCTYSSSPHCVVSCATTDWSSVRRGRHKCCS